MESTHGPTVIVADYSKDTRVVLKCWLEMQGCRVLEATDGQQAVELTMRDCPDLMLMSIRMPVLSGLDAIRLIRERDNAYVFPIVAMSTYPTNEAKVTALSAGCASFITQPIDFDVLRGVLSSLLPESVREQSTKPDQTLSRNLSSPWRARTLTFSH